jgi:hypothetical protein
MHRVTFVGRLAPEKRLEDWLTIATEISKKDPLVEFEVIGEGPLRPELEQMAARLGIGGRTTFRGQVPYPELPRIYSQTKVVMLTSAYEGFGRVLAEGYAFGAPAVSYHLAGTQDIVHDQQTGFLHPIGRIEEMRDSVLRLLRDNGLREQMASRGRQHVTAAFSPANLARQWAALLLGRSLPPQEAKATTIARCGPTVSLLSIPLRPSTREGPLAAAISTLLSNCPPSGTVHLLCSADSDLPPTTIAHCNSVTVTSLKISHDLIHRTRPDTTIILNPAIDQNATATLQATIQRLNAGGRIFVILAPSFDSSGVEATRSWLIETVEKIEGGPRLMKEVEVTGTELLATELQTNFRNRPYAAELMRLDAWNATRKRSRKSSGTGGSLARLFELGRAEP